MTSSKDELEFCVPFLGARKYLQGPSILEAVQEIHGHVECYDFRVRKTLINNRLILSSTSRDHINSDAVYNWKRGSDSGCYFIYSHPFIEPEVRVDFNEDAITDLATFGTNCITLDSPINFGLPTKVVSLNKFLLSKVWPIEREGRWVFVRMHVSEHLSPDSPLTISILRKIASQFIVRSAIHSNQRYIGTVDFVWR